MISMQLHQDLGVDTTGDYALHDPRLERQLRNSGSNRLIGNVFDPMVEVLAVPLVFRDRAVLKDP